MDVIPKSEHLRDEFWACFNGVEEIIFNNMYLCP
jgi:hypothetical protein